VLSPEFETEMKSRSPLGDSSIKILYAVENLKNTNEIYCKSFLIVLFILYTCSFFFAFVIMKVKTKIILNNFRIYKNVCSNSFPFMYLGILRKNKNKNLNSKDMLLIP
jgi:hypothetical protein